MHFSTSSFFNFIAEFHVLPYTNYPTSTQNGSSGLHVGHPTPEPELLSDQIHSTGTTGYIGGDGLYAISNAHPDWELSALVRNKDKAAVLSSKYPKIRVVHGDLDSSDIIEEEVKKADIVFRRLPFCSNLVYVA